MRVMCLCHFDDTNSSGGLDKQARLLARTLVDRGEDIVVVSSTRKWSRAGWRTVDGLRIRFFWTYTTPQVSGKKLPASLLWAFQVLFWVFLNRKKISVFHSHQIRIHAFVGALAQKLWHIPHILKSATGGDGADIRAIGTHKYFGSPGRNFVIRHTAVFIATTESIVADLKRYGVEDSQIKVIPNGLVIPQRLAAYDPVTRAARGVFLGRIDSDKNVLNLARAAVRVETVSPLTLDIYGKGLQLAELRSLLSDAGSERVRYCGFSSDTLSVLPAYGWMFLPSNAEGLSNAMLESMACGVVPVTTRVSGCVDHIKVGETGFFLEGVDVPALEDGIRSVAETEFREWQRLSAAVREYAKLHFDIEQVAGRYVALYQYLDTQWRND